jgi:acetoin:2,6-dichlorophenolindophenol oxidoreductase subunit alpha
MATDRTDREPTTASKLEMLRLMVRIRRFEERLIDLHKRNQLPGFVHLYIGEEAIAVGVCSALRPEDRITSTHRGHGHLIAKGAEVRRMMAELFGKVDGYCRGKGGSMHIMDFSLGILGTNGIVGGGIPMATGAAFADKRLGTDRVSVAFFGDGGSNQGVFFEAMNLASIWKLPVIFLCENNQYTEWTPTKQLTAGTIAERGLAMEVPGVQIDGNDVLAVRDTAAVAVRRARAGDGPSLIECMTYRHEGHNQGEEVFTGNYRSKDEIATWRAADPIERFAEHLVSQGLATAADMDEIDAEERAGVDEAVAFAEASPDPDPEEALLHLFADEPKGVSA